MAQDFIGQEITVGSWVATGGKGNGPAEYGMILFYVAATSPKLKLQRLQTSYDNRSRCTAKVVAITSTNPNKYVVVNPPASVTDLFERIQDETATPEDHAKVGWWIHGQQKLKWS